MYTYLGVDEPTIYVVEVLYTALSYYRSEFVVNVCKEIYHDVIHLTEPDKTATLMLPHNQPDITVMYNKCAENSCKFGSLALTVI